jgi:excisionase family DNA binding protein
VALTAKEAANYLGIDPKTLRQKLRDGRIRGRQNGGTWIVELADLNAYRQGTRYAPAAAPEDLEVLEPVALQAVGFGDEAVRGGAVRYREPALCEDGYESLALWSSWFSFIEAARVIPRQPGVYVAREAQTGDIVYVGMAAERKGHGMRGRLAIYARGRGATSGLGEGAMDRALADPAWLRERLTEAERGTQLRAKDLARAAIDRADLQIRWAETADGPSAAALEIEVLQSFEGQPLWNRRR